MICKCFKIRLNTVSAAKLFASEANTLNESIYIEYENEKGDKKLINGKSVLSLLQLDLHSILTVYIEYKEKQNTRKFKQSINIYIINDDDKKVNLDISRV